MNSTVQFLEQQLQRVSCDEFVLDETFYAEVRNLLDLYDRLTADNQRLRGVLEALVCNLASVPYRDNAGLRVTATPFYDKAQAALTEPPTRGGQ